MTCRIVSAVTGGAYPLVVVFADGFRGIAKRTALEAA